MPGLSAWAVRRPVYALIAWVVAMVAVFGLAAAFKGTLNDSFSLPETESTKAQDLLASSGSSEASFGSGGPSSGRRRPERRSMRRPPPRWYRC